MTLLGYADGWVLLGDQTGNTHVKRVEWLFCNEWNEPTETQGVYAVEDKGYWDILCYVYMLGKIKCRLHVYVCFINRKWYRHKDSMDIYRWP